MTTGSESLQRWAPEAGTALDAVVGALWAEAAGSGTTATVAAAATRSADLLDLEPLRPPRPDAAADEPWDGDEAAVLDFATQCTLDVASVTKDQRAAFLGAAGARAGSLAAALWVVDVVPRTRAALDALFGSGRWPAPEARPVPGGLWGALDDIIRVVPRSTPWIR